MLSRVRVLLTEESAALIIRFWWQNGTEGPFSRLLKLSHCGKLSEGIISISTTAIKFAQLIVTRGENGHAQINSIPHPLSFSWKKGTRSPKASPIQNSAHFIWTRWQKKTPSSRRSKLCSWIIKTMQRVPTQKKAHTPHRALPAAAAL